MAGLAAATASSVIDTKVLGRPDKFTGEKSGWDDWRWSFLNWVNLVNPAYHAQLDKLKSTDVVPEMETMDETAHGESQSRSRSNLIEDTKFINLPIISLPPPLVEAHARNTVLSSLVVESATFLWLLLSLATMLIRCIGLAMGSPRD